MGHLQNLCMGGIAEFILFILTFFFFWNRLLCASGYRTSRSTSSIHVAVVFMYL